MRHPRNVVVIGFGFIAAAAFYALGAVPLGYDIEWAGVTMLGALGVAMSLMAYVLIAGSSKD
ncbi:MAG TPA: hypothetical protein VLS28_09050 [Candidatus Sulfomarinibacteraceae bacterium]|nr:hypothetical protein [Candidatus Sulfomarinibacteraceae bacterium]